MTAARIIVCPSVSAAELCREHAPSHVVSLAGPGDDGPDLDGGMRRLILAFNDIDAPRPGSVAPNEAAIASLIAFGRTWRGERPLLVHCLAGISRSTAAAFILACMCERAAPEVALALALREAAPCATPNRLMIALADEILLRRGRMIDAVRAIGRGADYRTYRSFDMLLPWSSTVLPEAGRA